MIGSSSRWYASSARVRIWRSSAARCACSETANELHRPVDEEVWACGPERLRGVDAAPPDGDGEHAGALRRLHVEGRVADVRRLLGTCAEQLERAQDPAGMGLVARH